MNPILLKIIETLKNTFPTLEILEENTAASYIAIDGEEAFRIISYHDKSQTVKQVDFAFSILPKRKNFMRP